MDWFKVKVQHVLNSGLTDKEIGLLIKYQALIAMKERVPNNDEIKTIMRLNSFDKLQKKLEVLQNKLKTIENKVLEDVNDYTKKKRSDKLRKKRQRDRDLCLDEQNVTRDITEDVTPDVTEDFHEDVTRDVHRNSTRREDKRRIYNTPQPPYEGDEGGLLDVEKFWTDKEPLKAANVFFSKNPDLADDVAKRFAKTQKARGAGLAITVKNNLKSEDDDYAREVVEAARKQRQEEKRLEQKRIEANEIQKQIEMQSQKYEWAMQIFTSLDSDEQESIEDYAEADLTDPHYKPHFPALGLGNHQDAVAKVVLKRYDNKNLMSLFKHEMEKHNS